MRGLLKQVCIFLLVFTILVSMDTSLLTSYADDGEPVVRSITYLDKVNNLSYSGVPTNGYIYIRLQVSGENIDKLEKSDFLFEMDGAEVDLDDTADFIFDRQFDISWADENSAEIHFSFPANTVESERECKATVLCAPEDTADRVRTFRMEAAPESKANQFILPADGWYAAEMGDGSVRVHIDEPVGVRLIADPADFKHYEEFFKEISEYIYFADSPDNNADRMYLTEADTVTVEDNGDIIISLADPDAAIPYYVCFAKGAMINSECKTLGLDEYRRNHNRYITRGAHVDSISYNQITFDSRGGEVRAIVTGSRLNESADTLRAKVFADTDKEYSGDIVPEINIAEDGNSAEIIFTVPKNNSANTVSYRLTPVINGTNTVTQFIKGYDVISVLPEGVSEDDVTLSFVEIQGAYDMDDALDVFKTSTSSDQFTTKIDAVIRGTNLSSKRTLVKAVDENGITWPMLPVFECGATIRWQSSSYYLPERESVNEQRIELLLPRRLGVDRTFTLYFAPDGEHYLDSPTATVIVENDGLYDTDSIQNGLFTLEDFDGVRDIEVKYVDTEGNELAESDHYKGYGITELYHMGIAPKEIEGYKVTSYSPSELDKMLLQPRQHESGEFIFDDGQWFVKDLGKRPIVYTYKEVDGEQGEAASEYQGKNGSASSSVITKVSQKLKITKKNKSFKVKALKKAKKTFKALSVTGSKGKVTFTKVSGSKRLSVNKKTGKITIKKNTKKGSYKIKIKVNAAGNSKYKPAFKTVTVKVKVKS